jgi:ABC-2 type transport system permease protein
MATELDPADNDGVVRPPEPRFIGAVNWLGAWTHYEKEVRRFAKVGLQTLLAPVVTTLLFMAVFSLALGSAVRELGGVPFTEFLAPGLIMMAIIQNAFANTTSSVMMAKIQGNIVDMLMPPMSPVELTLGFGLGGATRGVLVAACVGLAASVFVPLHIHDVWLVLFHAAGASIMLSLLGLMTAIWAEKYDHIASITNFLVTPLSFLSGTFYSIDRLPEMWRDVAMFNPFFYLIDGFRYGFIGHHDGSLMVGVAVVLLVDIALWMACHWMFASGYKLKS